MIRKRPIPVCNADQKSMRFPTKAARIIMQGDHKALHLLNLEKPSTLNDARRPKHLAFQSPVPRMRPRNEAIWLGGTSRVVG
jgi:hypothetical protein